MDFDEMVWGVMRTKIEQSDARIAELEQKVEDLTNAKCDANSLEILSRKEVAEMLCVSTNKVSDLVKEGKLKCHNVQRNSKFKIYMRDVIGYLENQSK